jgi:hypothetical protein
MTPLKYEIFYSSGGHCGPYETFESAVADAKLKLKGCRSIAYIDICPRTKEGIDGFGKPCYQVKREEDEVKLKVWALLVNGNQKRYILDVFYSHDEAASAIIRDLAECGAYLQEDYEILPYQVQGLRPRGV